MLKIWSNYDDTLVKKNLPKAFGIGKGPIL
jgi:hypothetical protein